MRSSDIKVSVIIPVYNAEKYLEQCLESLLRQTLIETEIICVDDGSSDTSLQILFDYTKKDKRIQIIKQQNQFAGVARNNGMRKASGEYLLFLDADDFFEPTMLEEMYKKAQTDGADICICGGKVFDEQTGKYTIAKHFLNTAMVPVEVPFSNQDIAKKIFNFTSPAPWTKLFKRIFVEKNGLQFQGLQRTNDLFFTYAALALATKINFVDDALVNYRKGNEASLQATNMKTPFDFYEALKALKKLLVERGLFKQFKTSFINRALDTSLYNLNSAKSPFAYRELYERLKGEIFNSLGILECPTQDFYNKRHFRQLQNIMEMSVQQSVDTWKKNFLTKIQMPITRNDCEALQLPQDKVSVIIPIYNVEAYLEECLKSVINQSLADIEIICVNDGSTDKSGQILEQYAKKDNRIKVYNKKNGGLSATRNYGMARALGEYLLFLDSDDLLEMDALERLYFEAKHDNLDVLFYSAKSFYEEGTSSDRYATYYQRQGAYSEVMTGKELFIKMSYYDEYRVSACMQLLKNKFIAKQHIDFYEGILHEDNLFTFEVIQQAQRARLLNEELYLRRMRVDSIVSGDRDFRNAYGYFVSIKEMLKYMDEHSQGQDATYQMYLQNQFDRLIVMAGLSIKGISDGELQRELLKLPPQEQLLFHVLITHPKRAGDKRFSIGKYKKQKKIWELETKISKLYASKTWKIGKIALFIPSKIKKLFKG